MSRDQHIQAAERLLASVTDLLNYHAEKEIALTSSDVSYYATMLRVAEMHVQIAREVGG